MAPSSTAHVMARTEARIRLDPEFAALLTDLIDAPTGTAGEFEQVAASQLGDRRRRDAVDEFRAGALPTAAVRDLLGLGTPQAVHRLRSRGRLIGLQIGNQTWFPAWQFAGGAIRPDLPRVLETLGRFTRDEVAVDRIMRLVRDDLDGTSVASALDRPKLAPAAWAVLAELGA